jgi:glycosyl transferase family 25
MDIIKHAFYINLESRPDRKEHVEAQLKLVGLKAYRFNAIRTKNGAIGCSMSHLKCLQIAKENNWEHLLLLEDDIEFTNPELFKRQFSKFLKANYDNRDVVLLAGNNMPPYQQIADYCAKVTRCQTTTSYMVKRHYYDTLIQNIKAGIKKLMNEPEKHTLYAIDKYWFQLQEKDMWYLITPLTVTQREDYSDIEKRATNYSSVMLDLNKRNFFLRRLEQINQAVQQLTLQPTTPEQIAQFRQLQFMKEEIERNLSSCYAN